MRRLGLLAAAAAMTAASAYAADGIKLNNMLTVTGFIDTSYVSSDVDTSTTTSTERKTFNMDQAEVDFIFDLGMGLSGQVDLQSSQPTDAIAAEQAFINYDFGNAVNLTLGKFDTFIGLEAIEPIDMYQFSHSLVYDLEPDQHTGLAVAYSGEMFNLAGALVNGIGAQNPDVNDGMAIAMHLGIVPNKVWSVNLNYVTSDEGNANGGSTTTATEVDTNLMTLDVQYSNFGWTVGLEYADKSTEGTAASVNAPGSFSANSISASAASSSIDQNALSLMVNYAFSERASVTGRYSSCETEVSTVSVEQTEMSLCGNYGFTPNWMGRLEFRKENVETVGTDLDATIIALQTTLSF